MKKFYLILFLLANIVPAIAQDNIKRPDSSDYTNGVNAYYYENYATSYDFFENELKQNPKNAYAMLYEGYIYKKYRRYGEALAKADDAIKYMPKKDKDWSGYVYDFRASLYYLLGDTVKALKDYEQAYKASGNVRYLLSKSDIYIDQKRYDDDADEIERMMKLAPESPYVWTSAGRNENAKGNFQTALEKYNFALKLDPNCAIAYKYRADTYIHMEKYMEASQDVVRSMSLDDNFDNIIQMYVISNNANAAITQALKAQQLRDPDKSKWPYYIGLLQKNKGDYSSAENSFRSAIKIAEYEGVQSSGMKLFLAETLEKENKDDEALSLIDECLENDSTNESTLLQKSRILFKKGQKMAAIELVTQCINLNPYSSSAFFQRARIYLDSGMTRNALDDAEAAVLLSSDNAEYIDLRDEIRKLLGNTKEMK